VTRPVPGGHTQAVGPDTDASRGVVARGRLLWAILVASLMLTVLSTLELVALVGPAAVVVLAQPVAAVMVAGLVMTAVSQLRLFAMRQPRATGWRIGEPAWPAWCASWAVGRVPALVAVHGRDGPGARARRR
jgi:hypothetical protein